MCRRLHDFYTVFTQVKSGTRAANLRLSLVAVAWRDAISSRRPRGVTRISSQARAALQTDSYKYLHASFGSKGTDLHTCMNAASVTLLQKAARKHSVPRAQLNLSRAQTRKLEMQQRDVPLPFHA